MRRGRLCAIALLVGIAGTAAGCGEKAAAPRHGGVLGAGAGGGTWATPTELRWLRRLGAWNARIADGLARAGAIESDSRSVQLLAERDPTTLAQTQRALAPATGCSSGLAAVGAAPTARLRDAAAAFARACVHLEQIAPRTTRAVAGGGDAAVARANSEVEAGTQLLLRANDLVPPGEAQELPVVAGPGSGSRVEPQLSRSASDLAGREVEVRCWSASDWPRLVQEEYAYAGRIDRDTLGFAGVLGRRANLHPDVCRNLEDLVARSVYPNDAHGLLAMAASLVTLAHESQHLKGYADEAVAECYGMQLARRAAALLGVERDYADRMLKAYWARYGRELPAYRSPECRDGGRLDLDRGTGTWP